MYFFNLGQLNSSSYKSIALRGQFQRRDGFSETAGPAVEMGHVQFLQAVILEIPLHGMR